MEKGKMVKAGKNEYQHLGFLSDNIHGHTCTWPLSRCIQNLKTLALIGAETSVTEKRTNKGNGKQEEADSLLHNTTSYTQHLFQISKS